MFSEVRVLKPGEAFFLYNLPKRNILPSAHMAERGLKFRHWIAVDVKLELSIQQCLSSAHNSLLN